MRLNRWRFSMGVACLLMLPAGLRAEDGAAANAPAQAPAPTAPKAASEAPRGMGLSVEPGGILLQHVTPGQTYDLSANGGIALKISNRDDKPRTFTLSTHQPGKVGNGKWLAGYAEIPDPAWFWFDRKEVAVEPHSDGFANMFVKIPDEPRYRNQHWSVSIGVQGVAQAGEMLALAAYPRYQIETEPIALDAQAAPEGALGLAPSLLRFESAAPGNKLRGDVTLYNNDASPRRYRLSILTIPTDATREQITPSPGYDWVPQAKWIGLSARKVTLKPKTRQAVTLTVKLPKDAAAGQHREALLWVEPDQGRPAFARIQLDTVSPTSHQ